MESDIVHELASSLQDEHFDVPVSVHICSYRSRQVDADAVSAKAIIDGLVNCGLLQDDSPKHIAAVTFSQVKVKNESEEKTVVTITEI